ncbi:MAG TPA: GNAT family N-acetyltransferase [Candidatus Pelethocola excrementipullorum]|nr:GNAT family N-acetyltransferase [Candidatus Pelethocola excrementipullorum]
MELSYIKATLDDLEWLAESRILVLKAVNKLDDSVDMTEIKKQSYDYYKRALADGTHVAYLVFDQNTFVGAGGISFFQVMPTYHNPTGNKAYIMNIYTNPDYRRMGIAHKILDFLVSASREKGISAICLEATDMGRPLYENYGFIAMNDEMELPE